MNKIEYYKTFLGEVRKATGIDSFTCDESGLVSVRIDEKYNLNLQLLEETDRMLCFVELTALPADASKAVYRDLLVGALFGKDTGGGYFTVEPETETVVYNYFFDIARAAQDVDDFISTLEKILQLCDIWAERIRRNISGEDESGAPAGIPVHHMIRA
ncbi:MAG: type III secretion system chaperone [Kiritimatiellae bacterium]|nr:type III secretion system chaperone [Kiritimatiellia bacterium]MBQ3341103.1 type III secretion system chaperone [Kiritimatiellia bacterium]MBQ6328105.1 type III secretion system chaperone [Kiritimatiellia bacterium]